MLKDVLFFFALANGKNKDDFKRIYLLNETSNFITPCFVCRQALNDYCNDDLEIVTYNKLGESKTYLLKDLCNESFDEDSLK